MPKNEIKNTFTGGRMNKDLDERLITTGEYRDAMNVQVTTSDGSDVGSLHNIMGNYQVSSIIHSDDAVCVGSVADEKVNKLYWMIEGLGTWNQGLSEYYKADAIAEYDYDTDTVKPVVVDVYKFHTNQIAFDPARLDRVFITNQSTIWNNIVLNAHNVIGMTAIAHDISGAQIDTFIITNIDTTLKSIIFDNDPDQSATVSFTFESSQRALNFNKSYLITGINIIEKQLFWTDDNSEPKRIHIERYRDIGSTAFDVHSFTPTRDFTQTQLAYINTFPLLEEHITIIRQKPLAAPQLLMDNSTGEGITEGEIINDVDGGSNPINSVGHYEEGDTSWIDFTSPVPDFQLGNILILTTTSGNITKEMRVKVGNPTGSGGIWYNASAANCAGGNAGCTAFMVEILSAGPNIGLTDIDWHAELEQDPPMFEFKFPRFATRYKYEDGEYSAFSPFSEVAFLPDRPGGSDFDFVAYKGYNIGMKNQIRKLALKDFIPEKDLLPDDVIEIDILYKESNSPNIYSILTVKPDEEAWQTRVTYTGNRTNTSVYPYIFSGVKGYLPIESEMVHGVLPENQLLRPWDNVPRKAKAQEVSGNRLIYGNYLQNYNLLDNGDNIITPSLTIGTRHYHISKDDEDLSPEQVYPTDSYKYSPSKSIKSLRTYQLGIAYVDKYGRETPVLTDNNEKRVSIHLNEWWSDKQVKITGAVNSNPPAWAEYQKFFIKETSSEYYNLALDRWYDAEDGNIWLSFPSSERNKIDIDTYLILKKEHDEDAPILEEARYDILAIENEAPEFIKTYTIPLGKAVDDPNQLGNGGANSAFGPNSGVGFPVEEAKFVRVNKENFDGNIVLEGVERNLRDNIFIRFEYDSTFTTWYEVTHAKLDDVAVTVHEYLLNTRTTFGEDINILTSDPTAAYANKRNPITMEVVQKKIENRPEFDGRFFVKVHNDGILSSKVAKVDLNTVKYAQVDTRLVQYINTNGGINTSGLNSGPWYGWGVSNNTKSYNKPVGAGTFDVPRINLYGNSLDCYANFITGTSTTDHGKKYWKGFKDAIKNDETTGWFIDDNNSYQPHGWYGASPQMPRGYSNDPDIKAAMGQPAGGSFTKSQGIMYDTVHLSYSGFPDESEPWTNGVSMNSTHSSSYVNDLIFINRLTTSGTLWRWKEDPDQTVYLTHQTTSGSTVDSWNVLSPEYCDHQVGSSFHFDFKAIDTNSVIWSDGITKGYNHRNRWKIKALAKDTGLGIGSGPSGYKPTNDPDLPAHFANDGTPLLQGATQVIGGVTYPAKPTDPAPGIRQDGMGGGLNTGQSWNIPTSNKKVCDIDTGTNTGVFTNTAEFVPGSVTWQILDPNYEDASLKHSSHNPAIFETEPKENLDLEIYHEVGQTYPLEYNSKTNELYTPIGSVVTCWRSINSPWVLTNPTWNPTSGGYPGTDPIPVGSINIGGNPTNISLINPWVGPIIVSTVGDNTITLVDDSGAPFNNDTNWPEIHIVPGDHLGFLRPDGSSTSAIVTGASGNVYTLDTDVSNRTIVLPWFNSYSFGNGVESNRIRDDYNQVTIDKGPKVSSILDEPYKEERKLNGLIHSGIYNSTSGVNNLNQFIQAEKITKDLNPTFGSIQKLFQRRINLVAFCEDKIVKILSNKDALYNADGNANLTATDRVLGDAQPYVGEFGISKNPESFASENYRAYFTDKQRGVVLRLSKDGLTSISDHGMIDWFRDNLPLSNTLIGGFDVEKREYNLTLPDISKTLSFREDVKGWVSFKSFIPENSISLTGKYYTFNKGNIWRHHVTSDFSGGIVNFNTFYNSHTPSHVTTVFNTDPKSVKNFQTLNYEGTQTKVDQLVEYVNPRDLVLYTDSDYHNLEPPTSLNDFNRGWYVEDIHTDMQDGVLKEFIEKEGKWFNYIRGKEVPISSTGQIVANFDYDPNEFSWQGIGLGAAPGPSTPIYGCTDPMMCNFGCSIIEGPTSQTPCIGSHPDINGDCADGTACTGFGCCGPNNGYNLIEASNIDFCISCPAVPAPIQGCLSDPNAANYNCETILYPPTPSNTVTFPSPSTLTIGNPCLPPYNACSCSDGVTQDDGSCMSALGCTDPNMFNYSSLYVKDCNGDLITAPGYVASPGWNGLTNLIGSPCCVPYVYGCTDNTAFNYDSSANTMCDETNPGCTTVPFSNIYQVPACIGPLTGNDCCVPIIGGCLSPGDPNYNGYPNGPANTDDGSCACCSTTFEEVTVPNLSGGNDDTLQITFGPASTCPGYGDPDTTQTIVAITTITNPNGGFYTDSSGTTYNQWPVTMYGWVTQPNITSITIEPLQFAATPGVWTLEVSYAFTGAGGQTPLSPCGTTLSAGPVMGCGNETVDSLTYTLDNYISFPTPPLTLLPGFGTLIEGTITFDYNFPYWQSGDVMDYEVYMMPGPVTTTGSHQMISSGSMPSAGLGTFTTDLFTLQPGMFNAPLANGALNSATLPYFEGPYGLKVLVKQKRPPYLSATLCFKHSEHYKLTRNSNGTITFIQI